ncbi:alpha/beta hydrolase family protein [Algicella marina]|uniref:Dienelactone hydrolase n=1 Tax=Algicella marina TaxID=2683284 RepID=A0A6P1T2G3_9RHOB|nr:dienelactone hydrolase [Algicella marina]QHQ36187.1 dienelactone hydrolase [Algicella marina]
MIKRSSAFKLRAGAALVCAVFLSIGPQARSAEYVAGVRQMTAPTEERDHALSVTVWYPAAQGGEKTMLGDNIFFEGTAAMKDAPIQDGEFPLILLSHGAGLAGSADAMSWIATPLAEEGFIVAAPTHPGNTGRNRSAAETMKLWLRPSDISNTLDAVEVDPSLRAHVKSGQTGLLGLSMGGNTALLVAGARLDSALYASYCDTDDLNASLCEWVRLSGVDLGAADAQTVTRDNTDGRVGFVLAIDPAPADIFAQQGFSNISIPVALVNLGERSEIPATVQASGIADAIPGSTYQVIEKASHASMFAECKPGAAEIAVEEGIEDPICTDGGGESRQLIHTQLIEMVTAAFDAALRPEK